MHESKRVSLGAEAEHADRPWERRVSIDGRPTRTVVPGDAVSAEFTSGDVLVLFTNYDFFDGVTHTVQALRNDGSLLDELVLPDQDSWLDRAILDGDEGIRFAFLGAADGWRVRLRASGFWSFARSAMKRRTFRRALARRYLELETVATRERPEAPA